MSLFITAALVSIVGAAIVAATSRFRMFRGSRSWATAYLLGFVGAAIIAGCGSSSSSKSTTTPPVPGVPDTPTPGSALKATPFVLSPNQDGGIIDPQVEAKHVAARAQPKAEATTASSPEIAHWFYLINGAGVPAGQASNFTPNVLDVNGPAPNGAPNPNGGMGGTVAAMSSSASLNQLWKAVPAPTSGAFYLRSAQSFQINSATTAHAETSQPSALTGFGASFAALDLGSIPFGIGIYWNQQLSPTGDKSAFQQWTYDQDTAQLTNASSGQQLYNQSSTGAGGLGIGNVSPSSANAWYAYPSYYLDQVINQTPVAFPPFTGGEANAYEWFSNWILNNTPPATSSNPNTPSCTYSGTSGGQTVTTYSGDGIRCQYQNLNAGSNLTSCETNAKGAEPKEALADTSFTSADWTNVTNQLAAECEYAADVQSVWGNYTTIVSAVFIDDTTLIPGLVSDVVGSEDPTLHPVAADLIEGTLYTLLGLTGDPGAGAMANIMSMATNAVMASNSNSATSLKTAITTTAADMYAALATQFATINSAIGTSETSILEDWGKLQVVGPLALKTGYNGLSLNPSDITNSIEPALEKGYQLYVMQQLMQVSDYKLNSQLATTISPPKSMPSGVTSSTWAQYTFPAFGSASASNQNAFWLQSDPSGDDASAPDSQVVQTDILGAGGSAFELFNGINGWASQAMMPSNPLGCGIAVTLFNASPNDLSIGVTPTQGIIAAPGSDFEPSSPYGYVGSENPYNFELRPYGYLPIYAAANPKNLTVGVNVYDSSYSGLIPVGEFTFGSGNCDSQSVWNVNTTDNYKFSPDPFSTLPPTKDSGANGGGIWATIYQN